MLSSWKKIPQIKRHAIVGAIICLGMLIEYKEFFVSGIYNVLADRGAKVAGFATDLHLPFGTPAEYRAAEAPENKSAFEELL